MIDETSNNGSEEYITVVIAGQLFGLPILEVQDVFMPETITSVPLAAYEIEGVLNLRGRIVTAINMRRRLGVTESVDSQEIMAVGIEYKEESYGLIIDDVGEVLKLDMKNFEANPSNLDPKWAAVSAGVFRLEKELLVVLDVVKVLDIIQSQAA
ncbi:MAG: chemotaxis protein CheW [OCS116 cluster bacterium]|uniref:Chemotaxis protein CheW n=1 Tax=OCS116 cluster bacterium TaxID=2030921 RepID=A0A2A4Z5C8_9PROT|nr:chemotaxis protein CheW [OCS116 cluster bacterium]